VVAGSESPPVANDKVPVLERLGAKYLETLSGKMPAVESEDAVHILNPSERAALRRIERWVVVRAGLAGAGSALAAGIAEVLARPLLGPNPESASGEAQLRFWALVGGVTALASVLEIGFLYWDGLRSVHRLAHVAGLRIEGAGTERNAVAIALARAALELPNPPRPTFGVDPLREASKWQLTAASLLYKLKVTVTNFAVKALVRRALGRAAVRTWLTFVAVPVTAAWNAIVCWQVIREARIRVMGPSAAKEVVAALLPGEVVLSPAARREAVRAVGVAVVGSRDLHPNLVALLEEVRDRVGHVSEDGMDDSQAFARAVVELSPVEQSAVLRLFVVAIVLDGRLAPAELRMLESIQRAMGRTPDRTIAKAAHRAFVRGELLAPAILSAT
jgi:hypothetical protein